MGQTILIFFLLSCNYCPSTLLPRANPIFFLIVTYSLPFSRDAMFLSSSVLPPTLCFSSLFLCHVLWLHCSLVLSLYSHIVCCSLNCAAVKFTWIFDLLTATCKSSQERCTSPLFFPRLWSLITWGKWSPYVWGKWSSCV